MVSLERVEDNRTITQQEQKKKKKKSRDEYCSKAKAVRRTVASRFSSTARTCQFLPFEILRRIIPRNPFLEIFHLYDHRGGWWWSVRNPCESWKRKYGGRGWNIKNAVCGNEDSNLACDSFYPLRSEQCVDTYKLAALCYRNKKEIISFRRRRGRGIKKKKEEGKRLNERESPRRLNRYRIIPGHCSNINNTLYRARNQYPIIPETGSREVEKWGNPILLHFLRRKIYLSLRHIFTFYNFITPCVDQLKRFDIYIKSRWP